MPSTDHFGETALKQDITHMSTPCGNHTITHFRPREYFPAFYASRCTCVIHSWIPEGVVGR